MDAENKRQIAQDLRQLLDDKAIEVEALRKKLNREVTVNGRGQDSLDSSSGARSPVSVKSDSSAREITGMKYVAVVSFGNIATYQHLGI